MSIRIIADGNNRIVIGDMAAMPSRLLTSIIGLFKRLTRDIANDATIHHRFVSRSGNLERSIQSNAERVGDDVVGEVFINESVSNYGKYVHEGNRSWNPDKFIEQAFHRNENKIDSAIEALINREMGI